MSLPTQPPPEVTWVNQPHGSVDWWLQPEPGFNHRHIQTPITHPKDKQMVCKPPMALSAVQTQVMLASFQKSSLPNHSLDKTKTYTYNKDGSMLGPFHLLI